MKNEVSIERLWPTSSDKNNRHTAIITVRIDANLDLFVSFAPLLMVGWLVGDDTELWWWL